jgi:hypothetical protein
MDLPVGDASGESFTLAGDRVGLKQLVETYRRLPVGGDHDRWIATAAGGSTVDRRDRGGGRQP